MGGIIADRDRLFVQTPESFGLQFKVDVRVENEAIAIDTANKEVRIRRRDGSEYVETYDKLLLSPGSDPVRPPLEGIDTEGIFTLRNVEDTDAIKAFMESRPIRRTVIVGGGFIGLEMAENLHATGAKVSIIEMAPQVMAPVDFSIASFVHGHLQDKGVDLHLGKGVKKFEKTAGGIRIYFGEDETLDADLVLLSIGVRPNTQLARDAGIALGERGIQVDKFLQTSAPEVYAVGDAIEYPHPLTGQPWLNFLAGPANRQARIVADNMVFGNRTEYEGSIGTSIAKVFDLIVGATGLAAKRLKQLNIPYRTVTTVSAAHASYYPKAFPLTLKIVFDPETGKLYGGQCVGLDGVDKRIDQLAIFIKRGGTVQDLCSLEQAYAPPFSSAKDPLAIAGYTASNVVNGSMPVVTWRELREKRKEDIFLLDVRTPEEYALGSIEGSVNIPLDELREHLDELPRNKEIVIYCSIGLRGYVGLRILKGHGFERVYNLTGGLKLWESATASPSDPAAPARVVSMPFASRPASALNAGVIRVDACGLQCPGPILKLKQAIDKAEVGDRVEVISSDPGFLRDAPAWSESTGHHLLSCTSENGEIKAVFEKAGAGVPVSDRAVQGSKTRLSSCSATIWTAPSLPLSWRTERRPPVTKFRSSLLSGAECDQEGEEACGEERLLRKDVRMHASFQFQEAASFPDEHVGGRGQDDAVPDEKEEHQLPGRTPGPGAWRRRRVHRLPDVDGYDGHRQGRTPGRGGDRRSGHLHEPRRKCRSESVHLIDMQKETFSDIGKVAAIDRLFEHSDTLQPLLRPSSRRTAARPGSLPVCSRKGWIST